MAVERDLAHPGVVERAPVVEARPPGVGPTRPSPVSSRSTANGTSGSTGVSLYSNDIPEGLGGTVPLRVPLSHTPEASRWTGKRRRGEIRDGTDLAGVPIPVRALPDGAGQVPPASR